MECVRKIKLGVTSEGRPLPQNTSDSVTIAQQGEGLLSPRARLRQRQDADSPSSAIARAERLRVLPAPDTVTMEVKAFLNEVACSSSLDLDDTNEEHTSHEDRGASVGAACAAGLNVVDLRASEDETLSHLSPSLMICRDGTGMPVNKHHRLRTH